MVASGCPVKKSISPEQLTCLCCGMKFEIAQASHTDFAQLTQKVIEPLSI